MYRMGKEEIEAVTRVIESGRLFRYNLDEPTESDLFEDEWAQTIGCEHAILMTSGTAALICGLAALGVGPGDEVIVPAYTFMATALAPLAVGAVPILGEVDASLTLDPEDLRRKITPRTKAVIPVHMTGRPADLDALLAIAREHGLLVLEDAAQADGGSYRGRRLGAWGDAGAYSFNMFKIITCGEGGALVTHDQDVYGRAMIYHDGGCIVCDLAPKINVPFFAGWNYRVTEILAAMLRAQLTRLDDILAALRKEKGIITERLKAETGVRFNPVHDAEGDCATQVALLLPSEEEARAWLASLAKSAAAAGGNHEAPLEAWMPIDSGRHVYSNWEPVMEKKGSHHPGRDAFLLHPESPLYRADMCPQTLDVLSRTVYLNTCAIRAEDELRARLEITVQALEESRAARPAAVTGL